MAKYEDIRALAKKQLQAVTESSDRWKAFLQTAAIAYNYSFPNQLLIHEQSPTATAVADIAYWNNNAGRWVKRGAHGIAVFDTRANSSRLRYLFDISDTIPRAEIPEALPWVITDQNWRPVWDKIVADNHADSIQSALLMLSTSCVAQRSAMFTTALGKAIDGSSLQWAKPDEQRQLFIQLITQSCLYMAALRCGVDTARLDLSALESVNQFDTNRIALCLGSACQQAARPLMQQIGSITREIDSVARAEKVRYYGDKQEETNNTKEVNNGVHDGERLPNPGADVERAADAGNREVRQPAAEIPAGERPDDVRRDDAGGNAVPASGGDGQRSTLANRTDDAAADAAEYRPEPADRPDGLDAVDERLAGPSRGTGDAADLQPVTQEPQAESDTTPSAFSVPISDLPPLSDELILGLLAKESSSRADNAAILEYFNEHPDLAERSAFCKHCYKQIYTYLFVDDHTVGFIRHDMYLELWEGNYLTKTAQVNLTWDAVAAKIADLIGQGRLMVPIKATPVQQQMEQLTLTPEDSEKAGLPSHEQQAKNIDLAAEAKKWNKPIIDASGKYITEQDITDALCKGGGFEDSKFRIQQYLSAQVLPIEEDQARWLKKEYGIGGGTWFFHDGGHGFLDHMGKNLEITRRTEDGEYRRVLKWKEVAQRLRLLIYNDQYLTDAEKASYQAWAAEQQAARAANDAALAHAKHAIADFCENEGLNEPNFSDLTRVEFAYSTTEDDEHEIQVYANLLRNEIRYEVDGNIVHIDYFQDNHELAAQGIENSAFSDFINTAEAEFEKHHPTTRKVEKSPVTIGSTVYLEDDRPFTVEEIGRENIHLRDESFPLVGRAVSHEEFARLLAANPKNAALSAPEVPSRQEQQEETAEPIVGEVIEEPSPFVAQVMADAERLSAEDEPYHREPITYEAPYLDNLPTAQREKFAANIAAIQKLKEIEQRVANGGSPAFEDEQRILAQYTGWGGLSDAFDPNKSAWSNEYSQLKAALSESEYEAARSSTLTAFYTPATVIHPIYRALERFGVKGGKILEPSMGTGAFLAHGHFGSSDAKFYGVELDSITGRISKQLYQKANIQVTGYENALLPNNYFDCVIGNVPFGNFQVNDPQYNRLHFPIHDYFFAKSIDKLRTGGIMVFITSSGTLDKKDDRARKYIAERCDLIGAVRLPNNAFKGSGTKIMTDVIFLQKRDTLRQQDEPWLHLAEDANGITMNRYFVEHPEMICGRMEIVSGPYGPTSTCQPIDPDAVDRFGKPLLETQIDTAMQHLTATLTKAEIPIQEESGEDTKYIDADPFVRNFSYTVKDDKIYYREGAVMRECNPNAASAERIRKLVELNLRATKIYDTIYDENGKEQHKLNGPATEEAQAKQRMIEDAFKDWIFKDRERRESLVALYNEKFNCIRPREYDGSHIQFFGMNPEISLRPHQRNAIAHILYGHNTLLAHVVGAGKTYEMVAAAMEKKRLGLCSKTLVAVPNHLTGQFASEALKLYPNANILVTTQRDFEKSNRKRFCAKIATGNYDIVVIGHSQFEKIPLSDARKAEFIRKQIDELEMQLESMDNSDSRLTVKQLESKKKQLKTKLSNLLDAPKRDDVVTFEELGADSLMVDEAHNFKNLMTVTKMHNIAGISTTESQKASDLFMKCQYLDEITGARGVTFATGTPISNSMTELYTMQRYLQQYTLERNGLANFDSWAATFGETVTAIELAPEGTGYRTKTRFARFFNLPELMAMFKECADIQTADMLKLPVPALVGGKPTNIQLKPSEIQKQMVAELGERADKIRNKMVKPYEDNMLKITNDGRKLALDQRLIDPDLPDDPDSKVNICVGKIFEIWEQTMPQRSAQLVFCDLSTPKAGVFNVYDDMKAKLIERGIPETEIAFIHEANTDARKTELFGKVRSGAVRVLMGSTAKMGAGTNVQQRLVALHHLDVPWRPSDIEQREGRILRQGNENKEVYVFRYVTEGTFDAYSWQLIENKQKFIGQIMTSKSPARSCDDMDEAALSYAEVKALAAGNPLIKEKMDLDVQLTRLKTLKAAHDSQRYELENKIAIGFPAEIRKCKEQIENATVDAATVKEHSVVDADGKDVFCIQLEKKVYYEKEPAGKALLGLLGLALNNEKPVPIGYFKGMELQIQHLPFGNEYHARLAGSGTYSTQLGADVLGNLTRLSNLANGIEPSIEKTRNMQIQLEQQLASAEEEVKRPFPQATELTEKSKRLAVLEGLLNMNDKDIVTDTEPEQQCQTDNRQRGQEER